jgi:hypothetical protein
MSDAPRVDDMSGRASVDRLPIWCTEQQPEEQHESAVEDKVFGGGDHRDGICEAPCAK